MKEFFVYPGQLAVSHETARIRTILGSCVSVVLWDSRIKAGGLCHYLLPVPPAGVTANARYATFAVPELYRQLLELGCDPRNITAKVFGGGNVVNSLNRIDGNTGTRNIEAALEMLHDMQIKIVEKNVGGGKGRWIVLHTEDFKVDHRFADERTVGMPSLSGLSMQTAKPKVRVLVVDDSATVRTVFTKALGNSPNIEVVGTAVDPYEARTLVGKLKPDVLTLDIEMPRMNGVVFLEKLMQHHPMPVIMVSSLEATGEAAQRSLELGAIEFLQKPSQFDPAMLRDMADQMVAKIIAAATTPLAKPKPQKILHASQNRRSLQKLDVITVGGNIGSPEPLRQFLAKLPTDCPPVVISISTIAGFLQAFISKVQGACKVRLMPLAVGDNTLQMGRVYFAPSTHHVVLQQGTFNRPVAVLQEGPPQFGQKPCAEKLFQSCADFFPGRSVGIMFSSFGTDGVQAMTNMHEKGCYTIVQDPQEASSHATIAAIIEQGVADTVLGSAQISDHLMTLRALSVLSATSGSRSA